jgi:hypothetical protein
VPAHMANDLAGHLLGEPQALRHHAVGSSPLGVLSPGSSPSTGPPVAGR